MQFFFVLLFLITVPDQISGQHWNKIKQTSLGVTYNLPQAWYVGGYTNKKCDCVGSMVNSSPEGALSMMIVVGQEQQEDLANQTVWGYDFNPVKTAPDSIQLEALNFEKSISTWQQSPKEIVLRFVGQSKTAHTQTYILYFWGSFEAIQQYREEIEKITYSFRPLHNN
ncbi:MAG: hypothetical protein AB8E82_07425 [Aureispira sp.]